MSLISPTTLLVAGSISITLSPAALVWTMRTVAASSVATLTTAPSTIAAVRGRKAPGVKDARKDLVGIRGYFKLRSHVGDVFFAAPGHRARGVGRSRLRGLQDEDPAAAARETAGARALLRLP